MCLEFFETGLLDRTLPAIGENLEKNCDIIQIYLRIRTHTYTKDVYISVKRDAIREIRPPFHLQHLLFSSLDPASPSMLIRTPRFATAAYR